MEQQVVGSWSKIGIWAPLAHQLLFHFVLQNEIEQQMGVNLMKIRIQAPSAAPFVVPFRFTEGNGTTIGG